MPYSIDGKTIYPYEDFDTFDSRAFYDLLRGGTLPVTSAISRERYINYFEPEFAAGNDILYVHFSAAMSATFEAMNEAVACLAEKYPERRFYGVDTKGITIVSLNMCYEIGEMYLAGAAPEEIVSWAEKEVDHFAQYFFADDLKFFKRSGRVSGLAATMGTLLGVRPIIYMNEEGKMVSCGTAKGRNKAINTLLDKMEELGEDITSHRIVIGHTDAPEIVDALIETMRERFSKLPEIIVAVTNPTSGAHCGPNGVGISFHAKHR